MVLGSEVDSVAVRFGLYIDELQDFFASRGMHFGSPDDIFRLADRLSSPSFFQDEMSSMVRAIIYRESEGVSREELLELVAVAIGGPEIDLTAPKFEQSARQLLAFFNGVVRSLWKSFPGELNETQTAPGYSEAEAAATSFPAPARVLIEAPFAKPEIAETPSQPASFPSPVQQEMSPDPHDDVISRARAALERAAHPEPAGAPRVRPFTAAQELPAADPVLRTAGGRSYTRHLPFWIAGLGGISVGLLAGLLLHHQPGFSAIPAAPKSQASHAPARPKPTPYELPIRDTSLPKPTPATATHVARPAPVPPRRVVLPTRVLDQQHTVRSAEAQPDTQTIPTASGPLRFPRYSNEPTTSSVPDLHPRPDSDSSRTGASEIADAALPDRPSDASASIRPSVFLGSTGVMASNLVYAPAPQYPRVASEDRIQGRVVVEALVWRDGTVSAAHVLRGDRLLGEAAADAIRHWRYRPYLDHGVPSDVATVITVDFRLLR